MTSRKSGGDWSSTIKDKRQTSSDSTIYCGKSPQRHRVTSLIKIDQGDPLQYIPEFSAKSAAIFCKFTTNFQTSPLRVYAVWTRWPHHCANCVHNPQWMNVLSQQQPKGLGQWTWDAKSCLGKLLVIKDTRFFYIKGSVWVLLFRKHLVYINATYGICASPLSNFAACARESAHISKTLCY